MTLWNYLRDNIFNSFTYYNGQHKELHDELLKKADKHNMQSGASYGITMREIYLQLNHIATDKNRQ